MKSFSRLTQLFVFFAAVTLFSSCSEDSDEPEVTANENLFINEIYSSGDDWIELFNNTSETKDLSGYKVYDDPALKYQLPAGTTIPPMGFLIIYCDDLNSGLHTNFKLTSTGEVVFLENKDGEVIDKVIFPPMMNNQSYARFPDGGLLFAITGTTTQGVTNGSANAPSITEVSRLPLVPGLDQSVTVTAKVSLTPPVTSMKLFYRFNNSAYATVDMSGLDGTYTGSIPAMNETGTVEYYVEAKTSAGVASYKPSDAPADPYRYLLNTDQLPTLVINEFMALNATCCPDDDGGIQEFDDWIEIYNAGSVAIDIGGFYLSDDLSNPFNSKIASTNSALTTIQPGGYLVIWADGQRDQGELHLDFQLSQTGEAVALYYKDGRKIDEFSFGVQTEDKSMGRVPNGSGTFQILSTSSQGTANQ